MTNTGAKKPNGASLKRNRSLRYCAKESAEGVSTPCLSCALTDEMLQLLEYDHLLKDTLTLII